jgi:hypothetical protein
MMGRVDEGCRAQREQTDGGVRLPARMVEHGGLLGGGVPTRAGEAGVHVGPDEAGVEASLREIEDEAGVSRRVERELAPVGDETGAAAESVRTEQPRRTKTPRPDREGRISRRSEGSPARTEVRKWLSSAAHGARSEEEVVKSGQRVDVIRR